MLFYSFFKTLVGHDIVVELKNNTSINGKLHSVDQYLNIKLTDVSVDDPEKHPHLSYIKDCFIRGSVVRYVQLPEKEVDTQLLQDAARKVRVFKEYFVKYYERLAGREVIFKHKNNTCFRGILHSID